MSRKIKYCKELKLEIVRRYLKDESSSALANEYSIENSQYKSMIPEWIKR